MFPYLLLSVVVENPNTNKQGPSGMYLRCNHPSILMTFNTAHKKSIIINILSLNNNFDADNKEVSSIYSLIYGSHLDVRLPDHMHSRNTDR